MHRAIILLFIFYGCSPWSRMAPKEILNISSNGSCYYTVVDSTVQDFKSPEKPVVLEAVNPKFNLVEQTIDPKEIMEFKGDNDEYFFKIKESHKAFEMEMGRDEAYLRKSKMNRFLFCLRTQPAEYRKFSKKELVDLNYKIPFYEINSEAKVVKFNVKVKPKELHPYQLFFTSAHQVNIRSKCVECMGTGLKPMLKARLIALGYKLPDDNIVDERTISALKDFQKRKGIKPTGRLDKETLHKLGVKY